MVCVSMRRVWKEWGDLSRPVSWLTQISAGGQHVLSSLSVSPSSPTCSSLDPALPSPCRRESSDTHTSAFTLLTSLLPSISLYLLFYGFTPLSLFLSLSRSLSLSHLFLGASGEHELWKDNRQVLGEVCGRVCVCLLCGGGCAHLHVCRTRRWQRQLCVFVNQIPSESIFIWALGSVPTLNRHPQKPLTLESLSCPTRIAEISQYSPIYNGSMNMLKKHVCKKLDGWPVIPEPLDSKCIHLGGSSQELDTIIQAYI